LRNIDSGEISDSPKLLMNNVSHGHISSERLKEENNDESFASEEHAVLSKTPPFPRKKNTFSGLRA
jgi:hypothetical protein